MKFEKKIIAHTTFLFCLADSKYSMNVNMESCTSDFLTHVPGTESVLSILWHNTEKRGPDFSECFPFLTAGELSDKQHYQTKAPLYGFLPEVRSKVPGQSAV